MLMIVGRSDFSNDDELRQSLIAIDVSVLRWKFLCAVPEHAPVSSPPSSPSPQPALPHEPPSSYLRMCDVDG